MIVFDLARLFPEALLTGCLMAASCSMIGVYVILKRVVFISIALSESAACGIAAAMVLQLPPLLGAAVVTLAVVMLLSIRFEEGRLPRDAALGMIFLLASSSSILLVSQSGFGLHEVKSLLYGDLILAADQDVLVLLATSLPTILFLFLFQRPLVYAFFDHEASRVMGIKCRFWELIFFFMLGLLVSVSSKSGGALLVFCYLVVVPGCIMMLCRQLKIILLLAPLLGCVLTVAGLALSLRADLPGNQTIIVLACLLFAGIGLLRFLSAARTRSLSCRTTG